MLLTSEPSGIGFAKTAATRPRRIADFGNNILIRELGSDSERVEAKFKRLEWMRGRKRLPVDCCDAPGVTLERSYIS